MSSTEKQHPWAAARQGGIAAGLGLMLGLAVIPVTGPASMTQHAKEAAQEQLPIILDSTSAFVDYKNKTTDYKSIVITQGATRISADKAHAVGLDAQGFENGRWTFEGNVRIDAEPRGQLRSDEAIVEVRDKRIATATATGKPAVFQQTRASTGQLTRGHADLIVYDVLAGTVRLTKNAWLTDGQGNQISGPLITYNIQKQSVLARAARPGKRVHITVIPHSNVSPAHGGKSGSARTDGKPGSP